MTIPLKIRNNDTRQYPESGDKDYGSQGTNWAQDVTNAINATANAAAVWQFDAVVGSAAQVSAGTATHGSIAAALAAASTGWVIYVKEGTFTQSTILDIDESVTIIGAGGGTIINADGGIGAGAIVKVNASDVTLWNLIIQQGTGTPDYAIEIAAAKLRCAVDIKASGTFAIASVLNSAGANLVSGEVVDTSEVTRLNDPRYVATFDDNADWGAAAGGIYTITVAATTHKRGLYPVVKVQKLNGANYEDVEAHLVYTVTASGDVNIEALEAPDTRFAGRYIIL